MRQVIGEMVSVRPGTQRAARSPHPSVASLTHADRLRLDAKRSGWDNCNGSFGKFPGATLRAVFPVRSARSAKRLSAALNGPNPVKDEKTAPHLMRFALRGVPRALTRR
jgi:hypothetical protein